MSKNSNSDDGDGSGSHYTSSDDIHEMNSICSRGVVLDHI